MLEEMTVEEKDKKDFEKDLAAPLCCGSVFDCLRFCLFVRFCFAALRVRSLSDKALAVAGGLGNCGLAHQEAWSGRVGGGEQYVVCAKALGQAKIKDLSAITAATSRIHSECLVFHEIFPCVL